jgi:hypothetical protein
MSSLADSKPKLYLFRHESKFTSDYNWAKDLIRSHMIIASSKAIFTMFWSIHYVISMNLLPQGKSFSGAYFDQKSSSRWRSSFKENESQSVAFGH